jgi:hypothetical protein
MAGGDRGLGSLTMRCIAASGPVPVSTRVTLRTATTPRSCQSTRPGRRTAARPTTNAMRLGTRAEAFEAISPNHVA